MVGSACVCVAALQACAAANVSGNVGFVVAESMVNSRHFQASFPWLTENATPVQVAITNAATMEEVHRLESALKAGRMPEALPEDTNGATVMDEG